MIFRVGVLEGGWHSIDLMSNYRMFVLSRNDQIHPTLHQAPMLIGGSLAVC